MTPPITKERIDELRVRYSTGMMFTEGHACKTVFDLCKTIDWYRKALSHAVACETMHSDCVECIEIDQTLEV